MQLDHLVVSGESRDAGKAHVENLLDVTLHPGGAHPHYGTHNHLLGLADGLYLETIAIDSGAKAPDYPRWFELDQISGPPKLSNWVCQTADLDTIVRDLPEAGEIVALERGDLKWRMAVPTDGNLPFDGCFPALIQWDSPDHPGDLLPPSGCALDVLTVSHPDADQLQQRIAPYLDDARVHFVKGSPHLSAQITTPGGGKTLR